MANYSEGVEDISMDSQTEEAIQDHNEKPWYNDDKYKRYWSHYHNVWQWFKRHQSVTKQLRHQLLANQYSHWNMPGGINSYAHPWHPELYQQWQYSAYQQQYMNWMYMYQSSHHTTQNPQQNCFPQFKIPTEPATSRPSQKSDKRCRSVQSHTSSSGASRRSRRKRKMRKRHRRLSITLSEGSVTVEESDSDGESSEQFEMQITDDMLQFFAKSAKHRLLRDTEKKVNDKTGEEERVLKDDCYVELAEVSAGKNKASVLPPSERPGVKRTAEMKMLFGKGAAMIHGMETAMQLNFDRNCDLKQPKLWPYLPLNIKFD